MDFNQINDLTLQILNRFDHGRRYDRKNDPLVLVSLVSTQGLISLKSDTYFLCENDFIHNENLPQNLLSSALRVTSNIIGRIPFRAEFISQGKNHYCIGTKLNDEQYLIVTVICNFDDARDIAETLSRRIVSASK